MHQLQRVILSGLRRISKAQGPSLFRQDKSLFGNSKVVNRRAYTYMGPRNVAQ